MQVISLGDNLVEMSKPVFLRKIEKKDHQFVILWICQGKENVALENMPI